MDTNQIAVEVANLVSSEIEIRIAIISVVGVAIGSFITILGNFLLHYFQGTSQRKLDKQRKKLLKTMLEEKSRVWTKIDTLSSVIGANEEETKRLLIDIGARGTQTGNNVWALLSRKPLPQGDSEE